MSRPALLNVLAENGTEEFVVCRDADAEAYSTVQALSGRAVVAR